MRFVISYIALAAIATAKTTLDQPPGPNTFTPTPTLPSSDNLAPNVTPNISNPVAPDVQTLCPGYKASNVITTGSSISADLTLAGASCNVYGNDIVDLVLNVQYQNATRLNVRIYPKYLVPENRTLYILDDSLSPSGTTDAGSTTSSSDLAFEWTNEPSFQFKVTRVPSGGAIFDTYGKFIVPEGEFLELVTTMVPNYNIYGLPEAIRGSFRLPNSYTQTSWNQCNEMNDQPTYASMHIVHSVYLETRYGNASSKSYVVYGRNLHGQEWILKPDTLTYRTIGGSFDFYFFSSPTLGEALTTTSWGGSYPDDAAILGLGLSSSSLGISELERALIDHRRVRRRQHPT